MNVRVNRRSQTKGRLRGRFNSRWRAVTGKLTMSKCALSMSKCALSFTRKGKFR